MTEGTDAQAEVTVRLGVEGRAFTGRGADPDTMVACARAYLGALNKLQAWARRGSAQSAMKLAEARRPAPRVGRRPRARAAAAESRFTARRAPSIHRSSAGDAPPIVMGD